MGDADLDVGGERGEAERQEERGQHPLPHLEPAAGRIGIGSREPAPLDREAVEADAAVQLDRQQQQDVERPVVAGPHAVAGFVRSDQFRVRQHDVDVRRSQEEQREAREHLPGPERGVLVPHHLHVAAEGRELPVVDRELADREERVHDDQRDDAGDDERDHDGERPAEEEVALEELRDRPHRVVADQDGRHEEHVSPHEQREHEARSALHEIEAGRPAALARGVDETHAGDDGIARVHVCAPCVRQQARERLCPEGILHWTSVGTRPAADNIASDGGHPLTRINAGRMGARPGREADPGALTRLTDLFDLRQWRPRRDGQHDPFWEIFWRPP